MNTKKHYFLASLCKNGILGGGITVDENAITYHTNKLTVSDKYRHLEMKYSEIEKISTENLWFLPIVLIKMKNQDEHKFLVFFGPKRFFSTLTKYNILI